MKKRNSFKIALFLLVISQLGITGCYKDKTIKKVEIITVVDPCDSLNTDFATVIEPLIVNNCSTGGCHDAGSGGYHLISYNEISSNASVISNVINYKAGYSPMPQGADKLPDSTIQKFDCWVSKGMPQ